VIPFHAAIDLGAGSGRVFTGSATRDAVRLEEAHRFHYSPRLRDGHLRWDSGALFDGLREGLRRACQAAWAAGGELVSAGVDAWGVDYGLIDAEGRLLEEPICYRDGRTDGIMEDVFTRVPRHVVFEETGIQFLPFNTLFQLAAHTRNGFPPTAARLLLIPDLCHHVLCGSTNTEFTNASTTQLMDIKGGGWNASLFARLHLPLELMPDIVVASTAIGHLKPELRDALALPPLGIVAPATHDTASAIAGTPLEPGWAYISSGTWSLVGVERASPLLGRRVLEANVTNERGVENTFRFLKNVMGLWILESCRREWRAAGIADDLTALITRVAELPGVGGLINPDTPRFFNPPSMVTELVAALSESGQSAGDDPARLAKVVLDSLACRYASVITLLESLSGDRIRGVHVVGGGALNDYLNQATANATGLPVLAGPIEAAAMGNILMQAVSFDLLESVAEGRGAVARALPPRRFEPRDSKDWREAVERYRNVEAGG
jgi:rhamnulokinase